MQSCPDCHASVDDDAIFCDQCGYRLKAGPGAPVIIPARPPGPDSIDVSADSGAAEGACPTCGYFNR